MSIRQRTKTTGVQPVMGMLVGLTIAVGAVAGALHATDARGQAREGSREVRVESIKAVVNDQVISEYDVDQRMNLILSAAGRDVSREQREMLQQQAIQNLVDEILQLQEAAQFELEISDSEVSETIGAIGQQYDMSPAEFELYLESSGASISSLRQQIRAELAWTQLVRGRFSPQVAVSDDEVQGILERLEKSAGQSEYLVSEIVFLVDEPDRGDRQARTAAQRLADQLQQGAPFNVVARQFSESPTAAVGGDLGWIPQGQLPEELDETIRDMRPGTIAGPVRTETGYYILQLRDRRRIMATDPMDIRLNLTQLQFDTSEEADADARTRRQREIRDAVATLSSCEGLEQRTDELGASRIVPVGDMRLGDLPVNLRDEVEPLTAGQTTAPIDAGQGFLVLMVCDRNEPEANIPTADSIENNLFQQRLSMMARRYLRDLRRDAIVDYR
ncbi:MAG: peptidylprolyl isomerase [Sphingomonadales bacterium]